MLNPNTVFTLGAFVRRDGYNYYPSADPFADLGPPSLSRESVSQDRTLANAGLRSDIAYDKGINNIKAGVTYEQTFLTENDNLGIVDPTFNAPCLDANGVPVQGFANPLLCPAGDQPNVATNPNAPNTPQYPLFNPVLLPFDLTRGGSLFAFNGHTDVKELALYVQDAIKTGNWNFQVGIRGDLYNGITSARQAEPRLGIAYNIKPSNTVLRISYARTLETPFNENLILSSVGCGSDVLSPLLLCSSSSLTPLSPGYRNEFHAGLQQAFGKYLVFDGEYIWKYTHNAYDFSVLGNTPITFPIEWDRSKIPGYAGRLSMPNYHGLTALVVFSHVAARFFTPQVGGAGATPSGSTVFRIDHDENFNQTCAPPVPAPMEEHPMDQLQLAVRQRPRRRSDALLRPKRHQRLPRVGSHRWRTKREYGRFQRRRGSPQCRSGVRSRIHLQRRGGNADHRFTVQLSGFGVRFQVHHSACGGSRK